MTEGNYLLLRDGHWTRVRRQLDEVWYCDLDADERLRRLITRHERFGKHPEAARAWATGTDQRNADLIAGTRHDAGLVLPDAFLRSIDEADPVG